MGQEDFAADRTTFGLRVRRLCFMLAALAATLWGASASASAATPSVNNQSATNVAYSSATLNGDVNPNSLETKAYFEYGPTAAYGSKTAEVNVGSGAGAVEVSKAISSLTPNTEYHYRVVATNASGTSKGADRTFVVGWRVQTPASPEGRLKDVSCSAATECTAVGESIIRRWDGSKWSTQTAPKYGLTGVSCVSSSACTAVGNSGGTVAEFWNGTEWKAQTIPNPPSAQLNGVSCTSATECTAVGSSESKTLAMRWNGTEWKTQATPSPSGSSYLTSVSCTSSSFCMAAGYHYESPSNPWAPLSMRWNGTEWTLKTPPKPAGATLSWLYGVSCTSSTECTAVGYKEVNAEHQYEPMAQRWNGTEWKLQTMPNTGATTKTVEDVSCVSATDCTAIGSYSAGETEQPMALRWNGTAWTLQTLPLPVGSTKAWPKGVSCVASRGCEAVGWHGNTSGATSTLAEGYWRGAPPTLTAKAATGVAEKGATLNGDVNPNGTEAKAYFEYGTTTAYGTKVGETNVGSGTSVIEKSHAITGLSPNTTYHYRLVANNENPDTSYGEDATFTTVGPPTVSTGAGESDPTGEAATLNAFVDPNGQSTTYQFEYGTTSGSYSTTVPIPAESAGSEMSGKSVSYEITGLTRGTQYYFRVTATNPSGKVTGAQNSFVTNGAPVAITLGATEVGKESARLIGGVIANGLETKYQFEYGTTISYGFKAPIPQTAFGPVPSSALANQVVSGLAGSTVYHFRLVAENAFGTTYGLDKTFTTQP
ncbi:MAG: fibronectin type III domain-containing protein [Solirubrobacterales bacterium]